MLSLSLLSCFPKNTNYLLGASLSFLYSLSYHFLTKARKLNYFCFCEGFAVTCDNFL